MDKENNEQLGFMPVPTFSEGESHQHTALAYSTLMKTIGKAEKS